MAMVTAACIVAAAVITMAGPAGADIIMAGAAVAAIATTGDRMSGRDMRSSSAQRGIAALGQGT